MAIKQILLAGALFSLLSGGCNAKITPEPTPSRPVDPTWDRIQRTGRIRVATSGNNPPYAFYNDQFQLDGFEAALMEAVARDLGLRLELDDFAFDGLGAALTLGQVDAAIGAITVTDEREAMMDFSDTYQAGAGVALAKRGSGIGPLSSLAELIAFRVGVLDDSAYQAEMDRLAASQMVSVAEVAGYGTAEQGVAALQADAIDLFLLDQAQAEPFVSQAEVEIAGNGIVERRYAIAIPSGAAALQAEINRSLRNLDADGTLAILHSSYLEGSPGGILPLATPTPGATPTPDLEACAEGMALIEDISLDDGAMQRPPVLEKGEAFTKGWRIRNVGTCPWTTGYSLRYVHGNHPEARMGGDSTAIEGNLPTGQTYDLNVNLVAPSLPGTYQGFWQMFNGRGQAFGETLRVGITVPTETPTPTVTTTPSPAFTSGPLPTWTPTPPPVVGPTWVLVLIADNTGTPVEPVPGVDVLASFADDMTLLGSTGCNTYSGTYRAKESTIKISNFSFTRLACPTDELNDQENRYFVLFEKATRYTVSGNQLQLFRGENLVLVYLGR